MRNILPAWLRCSLSDLRRWDKLENQASLGFNVRDQGNYPYPKATDSSINPPCSRDPLNTKELLKNVSEVLSAWWFGSKTLLVLYFYEEGWKWLTQSSKNACSQWIYVMCWIISLISWLKFLVLNQILISLYSLINLGFFRHFETVTNIRTWIKSHKYWRLL